jgi:hypothetical protein
MDRVDRSRLRNMTRRLPDLLTALSLLLLVATAVLWARSYPLGEQWQHFSFRPGVDPNGALEWFEDHAFVVLESSRGRLSLLSSTSTGPWSDPEACPALVPPYGFDEPVPRASLCRVRHATDRSRFIDQFVSPNRAGFGRADVRVETVPFRWVCGGVSVPHWFVALLFASPGAWQCLRAVRRVLSVPPGVCPTCRYDLRATPDRCPECGTILSGGVE